MTYKITSAWGDCGPDFRAVVATGLGRDEAVALANELRAKRSYIAYHVVAENDPS